MISPTSAAFTTRGTRHTYQHDRYVTFHSPYGHIFAVFDGHGSEQKGHLVSHLCATRFIPLLEQVPAWTNPNPVHIEQEDNGLIEGLKSVVAQLEEEAKQVAKDGTGWAGSTLCVAVLRGKWLYMVNLGDSRCVLGVLGSGRRTYDSWVQPIQMSDDHVCTDKREEERIQAAGGTIIHGKLEGRMEVSRSIGDFEFKHPKMLVAADPDITVRQLSGGEMFLVLGSDGLFGKDVSNQLVCLTAESAIMIGKRDEQIARELVGVGIESHSGDNVTVVFVRLGRLPERKEKIGWRRRAKTDLVKSGESVDASSQDSEGLLNTGKRKGWGRKKRTESLIEGGGTEGLGGFRLRRRDKKVPHDLPTGRKRHLRFSRGGRKKKEEEEE